MALYKDGLGALCGDLDFIERDYLVARGLGVRSRARLRARGRVPAGFAAASAGGLQAPRPRKGAFGEL